MAAGFVNALAGGGTLITFPALVAAGIPAVVAVVTNTVALMPGYLGATIAQFKDLKGQCQRLWLYLTAGVISGVIGGLLLNSGEKLFRSLVPFLIILASLLLAISDTLRGWLLRRQNKKGASSLTLAAWGVLPLGLAAIYGSYFGAGPSVIVLAVLGMVLGDSLTQLNALKQVISFWVNTAAAIFFLFSGKVVWTDAAGMAMCGRLAGRIKPSLLRWVVVVIGLVVGVAYLVQR